MKLKQLLADDNAVSPVIGVILMVAITVILAAVIGTFVLGLGENLSNPAPNVSYSVSDSSESYAEDDGSNSDMFVLSHDGGDSLNADELKVIIRNTDDSNVVTFEEGSYSASANGQTIELQLNGATISSTDEISTGDTLRITETADDGSADGIGAPAGNDYKVQIVHKPSGSTVVDQVVELN